MNSRDPDAPRPPSEGRSTKAAGIAIAAGLLLLLWAHLFSALLSALVAYGLSSWLVGRLRLRMRERRARALGVLATIVLLALIVGGAVAILEENWGMQGGLPGLLERLADLLEKIRAAVPAWLASRLPDSIGQAQQLVVGWLRANAQDVRLWGQSALRVTAHVFIGFTIGLLSTLDRLPTGSAGWVTATAAGLANLAAAFADIVAAQLRIAAANAALTAVFLLVALPLAGVHMPLATPLVALTFVAGLVPIVGNLLSNGAILIVALTVSPAVAIAALAFLLGIHKLEYVLNAHFVAGRTAVPPPVLLASMLVLEALFGLPGLVAAPICCAWVFRQFGATPRVQRDAVSS
ncbi:AI-2E family transporter [Ramlibacter sp. MMS24-I3-19]|uniref:AI-2E family transporter n=1 Tax=Ramlibacter sp. MMS24-I3-19 TaxID=3416606 RepID=UPI003D0553CB